MKAKFEENRRRFCEANKIKIRNVTEDIKAKKPVAETTEEIVKAPELSVERLRCVICQQTSEVGSLLHLGHLHTNSIFFYFFFLLDL
jgi:hypothetical protein